MKTFTAKEFAAIMSQMGLPNSEITKISKQLTRGDCFAVYRNGQRRKIVSFGTRWADVRHNTPPKQHEGWPLEGCYPRILH